MNEAAHQPSTTSGAQSRTGFKGDLTLNSSTNEALFRVGTERGMGDSMSWRRDKAPLLDHLGAVSDHVEAHSRGGAADEANFVTYYRPHSARLDELLPTSGSKKSLIQQFFEALPNGPRLVVSNT